MEKKRASPIKAPFVVSLLDPWHQGCAGSGKTELVPYLVAEALSRASERGDDSFRILVAPKTSEGGLDLFSRFDGVQWLRTVPGEGRAEPAPVDVCLRGLVRARDYAHPLDSHLPDEFKVLASPAQSSALHAREALPRRDPRAVLALAGWLA